MDPLVLPAWLTLLIVVLASARIWRLLTVDGITEPLRDKLKVEIADAPEQWRDTLSYFISCPWCAGYWIAFGVFASALAWADTLAWQLVFLSLAINYVAASMNFRQDVD